MARRTVLCTLTLSAAASLALASASPALAVPAQIPPIPIPTFHPFPTIPPMPGFGATKNVILLIGDGMGQTHVDATRIRYYGANGRLNMEKLPALGSAKTYAVEEGSDRPELVTDSASAGTAWSSVVKTYNNALGKDSRGNVVPTIMEQAKADGLRTGNVSTAEITDATPPRCSPMSAARTCQGTKFTTAACVRPSGQGAGDTVIAEPRGPRRDPQQAPLRCAVTALLLLVAGTACTSTTAPADSPARPAGHVRTVVPARSTSERTRTPQPMLSPVPAPGMVQIESGPFTDRIDITDLTLHAGDRPAVTGTLRSTVDVSELIVLELPADFYDPQGRYLGSGNATYADTEFADSFPIAVPSTTPLAGAISTVLTVPQLVNE